MVPPLGLSATARWISFFSCRTFPGHQYCANASSDWRAQLDIGLAEPIAGFPQKKCAQVRDLLAPFAERRDVDADHAQPVVQILAELPFGHSLFQIGVGRGQHAHVDVLRTRVANRHDFRLLEKTQQLGLDVERQVADFVEEERAARGRSHEPG